jgi:hypothetical protein
MGIMVGIYLVTIYEGIASFLRSFPLRAGTYSSHYSQNWVKTYSLELTEKRTSRETEPGIMDMIKKSCDGLA